MNTEQPKRIVVVGSGITGLAAAHRLIERCGAAVQVTVLEASDRVGGVIRTQERDGFLLESGPDSFISEKPEAVALASQLGLSERLIPTNKAFRRSFVVRKGRLRPIPEGFQLLAPSKFWPFATSGICGPLTKIRMAGELFVAARSDPDADESLATFVRRRFGHSALEQLAQPLVGGIYTADPEKLSLRATMPRFHEMEANHGGIIRALLNKRSRGSKKLETGTSGARYSLFLSFDRGMRVLTDALAVRLPGGTLRVNATVGSIRRVAGGDWDCVLANGEVLSSNALILALPAYRVASLLESFDAELSRELRAIEYASTATINLAYARKDVAHRLDGFGFVVPRIEKRSILACTFSSVKFAGRAPAGDVLLRAFAGGALQPEIFALDDGELMSRVTSDLSALLGVAAKPKIAEISRWSNSMPQYHLGHLQRVERIRKRAADLPGIALAGNAFSGAGIPDCIRSGESAADELAKKFKVPT